MSELEKHLQIQLFDRQKSGVKPTMAERKLYDEVHLSIDNLLNSKQGRILHLVSAEVYGICVGESLGNLKVILQNLDKKHRLNFSKRCFASPFLFSYAILVIHA